MFDLFCRFDSVSRWLSTTATELSAVALLGSKDGEDQICFAFVAWKETRGRFIDQRTPITKQDMDSNPYLSCNFVDILQSQQQSSIGLESSSIPLFGTQASEGSNFEQDSSTARTPRRAWTPTDDVVLISSWLNTSKDPVVGNEQRSVAFWKRIAAYFSASPKLAGEKSSGQNENDVLKVAHEIFYNSYKKKFTLENAWKELCNDQKWCELSTVKNEGSSKKRKCDDGFDSASSQAVDDEGTIRPLGVKAARASIKQEDLSMKEKLSKMKLLESLVAKQVPLADYEEALKKKLINELMSTSFKCEEDCLRRVRSSHDNKVTGDVLGCVTGDHRSCVTCIIKSPNSSHLISVLHFSSHLISLLHFSPRLISYHFFTSSPTHLLFSQSHYKRITTHLIDSQIHHNSSIHKLITKSSMASSSHNNLEEVDDESFDQTLENLCIIMLIRRKQGREGKNEFLSKEIVKQAMYVCGMIISVKLQPIFKIFSVDDLE
uniref:No apical meristem-associated C-terminal domain-containing protein n=1 Tax=Brassica oleracea var. oleracea TaxID=109376 RepID=A0A0D3EEG1_BRAOL